jgi:photosystem II stability/assembly factor-like uncharacterized protein
MARTLTTLIALCIGAGSPLRAADLRSFEDAGLRAVQFIDAKEGWAAGDDGVVWHTINGGQTWERQPTGTRASLRSICFLDAYTGWAVGREELPGGTSAGVVLFTSDGGVAWKRLLAGAVPAVNQVRFLNPKVGFLLADANEQFPSGLFKTTDGGKVWDPVKGPRSTGWLGGDFHSADTGVLVGPWKNLTTLRPDGFAKAQLDDIAGLGHRNLHAVQILPKRVVAVGDGGLMLNSVSGGAGWSFTNLKLPPDVSAALDFHAMYGVGERAWVVGRPGAFVLSSTDAGESWTLQRTGQTAPLHGVFFLDGKRGWAVGDLGTILHTTDGGDTWKVQRQGGKRAAALFIHARMQDVPADAIAVVGGDEGYLTAVLNVASVDPQIASIRHAADPSRLSVAVRQAGGATGESLWQFPLPQYLEPASKEAILQHWNTLHRGRADRELVRQLVLAIRMWRPEVVIADGNAHSAGALVTEAVQEALRQAADAKAFPEQIETLGLSAWQAKKLCAIDDRRDAPIVHDNLQPRGRLVSTARDAAAWSARLLNETDGAPPPRRAFRVLASTTPEADGQNHLMIGVNAPFGEARRQLDAIPEGNAWLNRIRERRHLLGLAENLQQQDRTLTQIVPLLAQLAYEDAAPTAYAVAELYARRGQWDLAREAFLLMVDRYPAHPLSIEAYRWLIRHNSSDELRRRHELEQFVIARQLNFDDPKDDIQQVKGQTAPDGRQPLSQLLESRRWHRGNAEFGKRLGVFGPLFAYDPATQFCLQASKRQLGDAAGPQRWLGVFKNHVGRGPWHDVAAAELWLTQRDTAPPRRLAICRLTEQRPHLDGVFDDACWKGQKPLVFEDAAGATAQTHPTEALFAHDQEFLYVALKCRHPEGRHLPKATSRERDAELTPYDRVSILLDLDRDYATFFRLEVDQRGCVRDDCCGDLTWNPKWYVACNTDAVSWHIEAAIPLGELTGQPITLGSAWACNLVRTIPGHGVQAYSLPADVTPRPDGMCLLLFQQAPNRAAPPMLQAK